MPIATSLRKLTGWTFPADRRSPSMWDAFWADLVRTAPNPTELAQGSWSPPGPHGASRDGRYYGSVRGHPYDILYHNACTDFRELGYRRILYPGCGIDVLPYFLEYEGFDTVAIDLSASAIEYEGANPPGPGWRRLWVCQSDLNRMEAMLAASPEAIEARWVAERVAGGSLSFRVGDAFDLSNSAGGYDAVITRNLLEHYEPADRAKLLAALFRCLRPGGQMLLQTEARLLPDADRGSGAPGSDFSAYEEAAAAGFATPHRQVAEWLALRQQAPGLDPDAFFTEHRARIDQARAEEREAVARGEKAALIFTG